MKLWFVAACSLFAALSAHAGPITTRQSGFSQVEIGGVRVLESGDAQTDGRVSVSALFGTLLTPEARTAARSGANEMAVNSRLDDKSLYSNTDFSLILSQAAYTINFAPDNVFLNHGAIDFALPPSYLEATGNAEVPFITLETVLLADLRVCLAVVCTLTDVVMHLQANLDASHRSYAWSSDASGDPRLDLDPLRNPTVTDSGPGFLRTINVAFPLFQGHLDVGIIPAGSPLTVEYIMQTRARGLGFGNIGIAAINDPFLLDTDPVRMFDPVTLSVTRVASDVPEPSYVGCCLLALAAGLCFLRKRT